MSVTKQKSLDAMRTFARDVEKEKAESNHSSAAPKKVDESTVPKMRAVKSRDAANPVPEQKKVDPPVPTRKPKDIPPPPKAKTATTPIPPAPKDDRTKKPEQPAGLLKEIPPFHEFQKQAAKHKTTTPTSNTKEKDNRAKHTVAHGSGKVITDTKKTRPSFFTALGQTIQHWWGGIKKSLTPKKKTTYAVSTTERRKGVVQKATSKTSSIFNSDNDALREKIKARNESKEDDHEEDITWSPYTETGYPLLEEHTTESADPRVVSVSMTPKTHTSIKPVIKESEPIPELQSTETAPTKAPEPRKPKHKPIPPASAPATAQPPETSTQPAHPPVPTPQKDNAKPITKETTPSTAKLRSVLNSDTNTLVMIIAGVILGIGIIVFTLINLLSSDQSSDQTTTTRNAIGLYSEAAPESLVLDEIHFNTLLERINSAVLANQHTDTVEYQFVDGDKRRILGMDLMTVLKTDVATGFSNTITDVRFIESADERALLLTTSDHSTALGGMLNWEASLSSDVGPILDIQGVPLSAGVFEDTRFGSLDVRVLIHEGEPLLVYALVNDTDILIASNLSLLVPFFED